MDESYVGRARQYPSGTAFAPCTGFVCRPDNDVRHQCACVCPSAGMVRSECVALYPAVLIIYKAMNVGM